MSVRKGLLAILLLLTAASFWGRLSGYSDEADHLFQSMSISRSDSCRSLVPIHADHRFQLNAIGA